MSYAYMGNAETESLLAWEQNQKKKKKAIILFFLVPQ